MHAAAFVVGAADKTGIALVELARRLGFAQIEPYTGIARAEELVERTPLIFFLCAEVADVRTLRPVARAVRFSDKLNLRFSPLIYLARELSVDGIRMCIRMGFDDIISLPYPGGLPERIGRQLAQSHTYYETATYFGPDRRNRGGDTRSTESDHGGGQYRRIEIMRRPETGIEVLRDDFHVAV